MKIRDTLLTVALSVVTTLTISHYFNGPGGIPLHAAPEEGLRELTVDRLIVHKELIVSDTGKPWDTGFEEHQIPRGIVVRSLAPDENGRPGTAGLWVRSRIIKSEIDDPFDDRFHAINRDGTMFRAPGHISWNVWLDDAWRQCSIIQGEILEPSEIPADQWNGGNHPGRLRFQTFRPHHGEPLTDAIIGQGMMSLGGGGYGGGGLPYPSEVLQLWGGKVEEQHLKTPSPPRVINSTGDEHHTYALIAVSPQGQRSAASDTVTATGLATLEWDSVAGADAYIVIRDGVELPDLLRIEGSNKQWTDEP